MKKAPCITADQSQMQETPTKPTWGLGTDSLSSPHQKIKMEALKMNRSEYIQQRAAIDEAAKQIAMDLIHDQFPDVEWTPTGKCKLWQNGTLARLHPEYDENAGVLPPLFLPLTAFITVYNILRRNPESVESAIPTWHHFTPFYAIIKIQIPPSAPSIESRSKRAVFDIFYCVML